MKSLLFVLTVMIGLLPSTGASAQESKSPFSVYVFTVEHDQDGFIDAAARARKDAVADVRRAIRNGGFSVHRVLRLANKAGESTLQIEITGRTLTEGQGRRGVAIAPMPNVAVGHSRPTQVRELRAMLSVGTYAREFQVTESESSWAELAARLVDEIAKFAKDNRAKLTELASPKP